MDRAEIKVHIDTSDITSQDYCEWPQYSFEWIGDDNAAVGITQELLEQVPDLLLRLPWALVLIGTDPDMPYINLYKRREFC